MQQAIFDARGDTERGGGARFGTFDSQLGEVEIARRRTDLVTTSAG